MNRVAGLLLAAGGGSRFGGPKAGALFAGESLASRGVRLLRDGGCEDLVVVLGAEAATLRRRLDLGPAEVAVAEDWEEGIGASLRAGLHAVAGTPAGACVVALADQPLVGPDAVRRLRSAWEGGAVAAAATYGGRRRNPVLLDRSLWPDVIASAVGDVGARGLLDRRPDLVTPVPCDATGRPDDVDTRADLARLAATRQR